MWIIKRQVNKRLAEFIKKEFLKNPTSKNINKIAEVNAITSRSVRRYLASVGVNSPIKRFGKSAIDKLEHKE